jgi:riboflavin kinase/FMN adenylyltransferase
VAAAREVGGQSVVLTFDRHPREALQPGWTAPVLTTLEERLDLIEAAGIDATVVASVTPEFLAQEPEEFVQDLLVRKLGAKRVLAGENFRFGHKARGDVALLQRMGEKLDFTYEAVPPVMEAGSRISSSRVAECIRVGRVDSARTLLGRPYSVPGIVVRGDQVGTRLGFPTANVRTEPERLLPADGVYVVRTCLEGDRHPAVANLGVRPTVDGTRRLLEVHLLDWTGNLYEREVRVEFLDRLRDEQRFPDLEALKAQINRDAEAARAWHDDASA